MHQIAKSVFEFGPFRLDGRDGSLTAEGRRIQLPPKAIDVLLMLVEDAGNVVSKERLAKQVWAGTTVGEASANYQVFLIRRALRSGMKGQPCIETVSKRGFRFVAPVRNVAASEPVYTIATGEEVAETREAAWGPRWRKWVYVAAAIGVIVLAIGRTALSLGRTSSLEVVGYTALTHDRELKIAFPPMVNDGERVYYRQLSGPASMGVPVGGGNPVRVVGGPDGFDLLDVSPAGAGFLAARPPGPPGADELWMLPVPSGAPRRVADLMCEDATWAPDGRELACATVSELYVARSDGTNKRKLATPPGGRPRLPRWSPDGQLLRFTLERVADHNDPENALWEVRADGTGLRPLLPGWNYPAAECCGGWTPDGEWFVFQSARGGRTDLWALRERKGWLEQGSENPIQLTFGPLSFQGVSVSRDGKTAFAIGRRDAGELLRFDQAQRELVPYLPGLSAIWLTYSPNRRWIAYSGYPDAQVWRSRSDGTDRQQLTFGPFTTDGVTWSPDGTWIAFRSHMGGKHFKIYLMPAAGGEPRAISDEDVEQGIPSWSPDGHRLAFSDVPAVFGRAEGQEVLHIYDVTRREFSVVPGSLGQRLWACRWSPDRRYLSALTIDGQQMRLFDFTANTWRSLPATHVSNQTWSHDGQFVYYDTEGGTRVLRRVRVSDGRVEDLVDLQHESISAYGWSGLTPDDSPVILRDLDATEVYALRLNVR